MMRILNKIAFSWSGLLVLSLLLVCCAAAAHAQTLSEQQVKAAFLFNFAKFVEWPVDAFSGPDDPIVFCVLGHDRVGDAIAGLAGKIVQGRKVAVRRHQSVQDTKGCHVLYVSESHVDHAEGIIAQLRGVPVLLIADDEDFARRGGMINFVLERNKVGFEINAEAIRRARLTANAQLLKLARTVY